MSYRIFTDNGSNLTPEMYEEYGIEVLSLKFTIDGKEYVSYKKGTTIDIKMFYDKMRNKEHITTSLVNADEFATAFEEALKNGEDVLYIGLSSGISGTYQASTIAASMLKDKYPDRKIIMIDSLAASIGEGMLVYDAAKLKAQGKSIDEVAEWVENNKLRLNHWFTVDDLFFLMRGGRVSRASATFGEMLSVKPVMHVDDAGKLIVKGKVMGRKKSLNTITSKFEETGADKNQTVFITHGDCADEAAKVEAQLRSYGVNDVKTIILDPSIGAHSGPGTMAVFFYADKR